MEVRLEALCTCLKSYVDFEICDQKKEPAGDDETLSDDLLNNIADVNVDSLKVGSLLFKILFIIECFCFCFELFLLK